MVAGVILLATGLLMLLLGLLNGFVGGGTDEVAHYARGAVFAALGAGCIAIEIAQTLDRRK